MVSRKDNSKKIRVDRGRVSNAGAATSAVCQKTDSPDPENGRSVPADMVEGGEIEYYLREMRRKPLLTRDEELDLARRMASGREKVVDVLRVYPKILEEATGLMQGPPWSHPDEKRTGSATTKSTEGFQWEDLSGHQVERFISKLRAISVRSSRVRKDLDRMVQAVSEIRSAKARFVEANLRLVLLIARRYAGRGVHLPDLIQEGNLGLMRAVDKFDHRLGYKFSTYAVWWIRQAVHRAIQNQAKTIRIPVHRSEIGNRVLKAIQTLSREHGRQPDPEEIAAHTGLTVQKVKEAMEAGRSAGVVSMDDTIGDTDIGFAEAIPDTSHASPEELVIKRNLESLVRMILSTLSPREATILSKRFGIGDDTAYTLEALGREMGLTRERVRQIEAAALKKLRQPSPQRRCLWD